MSKLTVRKLLDFGNAVQILLDGEIALTISSEQVESLHYGLVYLKTFDNKDSKVETPKHTTTHPGVYVLHLPVQYMQENVKEKDIGVFEYLKSAMAGINAGEQSSICLPSLRDGDNNLLFSLQYVGPQISQA